MRRWICRESMSPNFTIGKTYRSNNNKKGFRDDCGNIYKCKIDGTKGVVFEEVILESLETQEVKNPDKQELPNPIRPNHYKSCSIECIDAMILTFGTDAVAEFCIINAFKYIWRHKDKNGIEDLNKAMWYIDKAEELKYDDTRKIYTIRKLAGVLKGECDGKEN